MKELAKTGVRDMPSNAMWLIGKLLPDRGGDERREGDTDRPASARERRRGEHAAKRRAASTGSIDSLLRRADVAADRATSAEAEALERAKEAKELAEDVRRIVEDAEAQLVATQIDANKQMASQVLAAEAEGVEKIRRAELEMTERVERIRSEGMETSQAELDRMRERLSREADEARAKARKAADRALDALAVADESVAQASELATQAKRAAEAAAAEAADTAQRLEWGDRALVEEAASLSDEGGSPPDGVVREGRSATVSSSTRSEGGQGSIPPDDLDTLTHVELLAIAVTNDVPDCGAMTRDELLEALSSFTLFRGDA